jgi:hypothetical protein
VLALAGVIWSLAHRIGRGFDTTPNKPIEGGKKNSNDRD